MNTRSPVCGRCRGTRFLHVQHARDAAQAGGLVWRDRPVGTTRLLVLRGGDTLVPMGHFDLLLCRGCGLTVWYAVEREGVIGVETGAACSECREVTPHLALYAVEHGAHGEFPPMRITDSARGREGFLSFFICTRCERVDWFGHDYAHLDAVAFAPYHVYEEPERPCLACGGSSALVDEQVIEHEQVPIPIAVFERSWLRGLIHRTDAVGHFSLRLCRPCGAVEWYARDFAKLEHDPAHGIVAIDVPMPAASSGGPYR